ncbi:MAG: glycoside hydrolase family 43 protein [Muribaculaceae bacterium]|nr:glycoside hydrolase family 43 protein [Muribaculaceae bacterium]
MTVKSKFSVGIFVTAFLLSPGIHAGSPFPKTDKGIEREALRRELGALTIPGGVNMRRSDLRLPSATADGTAVVWKSSDPSYIDNSGKVLKRAQKGKGKKEVTLTATAKRDRVKESRKFKVSLAEQEDYDSYLFVYFPSNSDENLYYAIGDDGYNYTPLNGGKMVMSSDTVAIKKGIRDPHILRGPDGRFYMVATDMQCREGWSSNRGIVMYSSDDMVNWKHSTVHFPDRFKEWVNVKRVWAPEVIWDPDYENTNGSKGRFLVFFSLLTDDGKCDYDKIYYSYANDDFTDLITEPVYFYDRGSATIDGDIVYDDRTGLYHMVYKNEGNGSICQVTASRLTAEPGKPAGSQWQNPSGMLQQTDVSVEGAGMFRLINSDSYILMYDCYMNGFYQFCESEDLENFKLKAQTETKGAFTPRHGTVIPITKEEKERLLEAFPIDK